MSASTGYTPSGSADFERSSVCVLRDAPGVGRQDLFVEVLQDADGVQTTQYFDPKTNLPVVLTIAELDSITVGGCDKISFADAFRIGGAGVAVNAKPDGAVWDSSVNVPAGRRLTAISVTVKNGSEDSAGANRVEVLFQTVAGPKTRVIATNETWQWSDEDSAVVLPITVNTFGTGRAFGTLVVE